MNPIHTPKPYFLNRLAVLLHAQLFLLVSPVQVWTTSAITISISIPHFPCVMRLAVNSLIAALRSSLRLDSNYLALLLWHELAKENTVKLGKALQIEWRCGNTRQRCMHNRNVIYKIWHLINITVIVVM